MWSGIWSVGTTRIDFWAWIWSTRHCRLGAGSGLFDFNVAKTQLFSLDRSSDTGAIDVKIDGSVLSKNHLLRCWVWLSLLNWIGALTLSLLLKLPPKKIVAMIRSIKFLSPEVSLYLYKSTIRPCMDYCCHIWAGAPNCYWEFFGKLQKRIYGTVGPSLAASLEPLYQAFLKVSIW